MGLGLGGLTISPMTWLSLRSVRFTPRMPNTTKTMAPVSTRGRTAGRPHTPPLQGLKPNVLDGLALAADEGSVKIESKNHFKAFLYTELEDVYMLSAAVISLQQAVFILGVVQLRFPLFLTLF